MKQYDLIVIGGGPGGYTAALRAAQLDMKVACIDNNPQLGGTCLRVGCIPSKALLESSELYEKAREGLAAHGVTGGEKLSLDLAKLLKRKNRVVDTLTKGIGSLFKRGEIEHLQGRGRLAGDKQVVATTEEGETKAKAEHVLIATGSRPAELKNVKFDGDRIGGSTDALSYEEVPKHLIVIGGGYIGLELGTVWRRLGSRVSVLEVLDRIFPGTDSEVAEAARKLLQKQGIEFLLESKVDSAESRRGKCIVKYNGSEQVEGDRVLLAVGRVPETSGLGLEDAGVEVDKRGYVRVDENYRTSAEGVYAIGDVIGGAMLAHKAEQEGVACVEQIATGYGHVNYSVIPSVIFIHPEIAAVGETEDALKQKGVAYAAGKFPFRANGRARTLDDMDGFVKVLADQQTDRVLGVHILGPRAGDIISEAAAAMAFGASSEDIAEVCHAHPTLPEALKEAALDVSGRSLNK